ncbi:MAG TPA: SusD/RagB family nutrient-binding outer membrane lipoprotein, partial [Chitinophagaceae bacterium]|nr:SusD/RagB family nutrient-binding outer membrane lipoprotein [Chitinophagaceae bacterium]
AEIDGALGKDFGASTNTSPGNSDLVFQGDIDKWKRFANTLELKMYLRMINAKPADAQAGVQKLYTNGAKFLSTDAGVFGFSDEPGLDNPLYEQNIRQLNVGTNLRASRTFVSWLMANSDSRIVSYFGSATPNSINQGDYLGSDPTYGTAAVFVEHPTDPVIFISKAESYFLQAEARERFYLGDNAKALYDNGVLASFQSVNQNGSQFIGAGKVYEYPAGGSLAQKIEAIVVQKWASFPYGAHFIESFFEKQRTGFPTTSPVYSTDVSYVPGEFVISKNSVLSIGKLPRRLVFPDVEVSRNTNTPALVPITESVWWAKP